MISIYINNQLADYFGDLTIKKDNPLFSDFNAEPTEHTYTLTLPTTATNAKIFSLIQHTLATPQKLPARIEIDGVQVLEGSCNVQSWSDSGYSVYFSGIAPYEDVNISPIKKMLGDTSLLSNIINIEPIRVEHYYGVFKKAGGYPAISAGSVRSYNELGNSIIYESNVAYSIGYLIELIANYYGVEFTIPDIFYQNNIISPGNAKFRNETFENVVITYLDAHLSLPRLTAKELLFNCACAFGRKLRINYKDNKIVFFNLNSELTSQPIDNYNVADLNFNSSLKTGGVEFSEIEPVEIEEKDYHYSQIVNVTYDENAKLYKNKFSISKVENNLIFMPRRDKDVEDNVMSLCSIEDYTYGVNIKPPIGLINDDNSFQLYRRIKEKNVEIKVKARLSPLQYLSLSLWNPIFLIKQGNAYIKSITFKPDGESDIEAYLY